MCLIIFFNCVSTDTSRAPGLTSGFAGVRECPPWCSIVGAKVTVHQFFCIFSSINGQLVNRRMYVVSLIRMNNLLLNASQAVMVWNSVSNGSAFLMITPLLFLYNRF